MGKGGAGRSTKESTLSNSNSSPSPSGSLASAESVMLSWLDASESEFGTEAASDELELESVDSDSDIGTVRNEDVQSSERAEG